MQKPYAGSTTGPRERAVRAPLDATNDVPPEWVEQWRHDEESPYQSATPADIAWRFGRELFRKGQSEPDTALGRIGREMTEGAERNASARITGAPPAGGTRRPTQAATSGPDTATRSSEGIRMPTAEPSTEARDGMTTSLGFDARHPAAAQSALGAPMLRTAAPEPVNSEFFDSTPTNSGQSPTFRRTEQASLRPRVSDAVRNRDGRIDLPGEDVSSATSGSSLAQMPSGASGSTPAPVVNQEQERIDSILSDRPAIFEISNETPTAHGPYWGHHPWGKAAVDEFGRIIEEEAKRAGVDADLLRAIIYVENARGTLRDWAGEQGEKLRRHGITPPEWLPSGMIREAGERLVEGRRSFLPANVREDVWGSIGGPNQNLGDPRLNIRAAATIVCRISDRLSNPTIAAIASIYNFTGAEAINNYGAIVARVYEDRTWEEMHVPGPFVPGMFPLLVRQEALLPVGKWDD